MDRTESTENTADAEGIANRLAKTVFFGDFKVNDRTRVIKTYLNCVYNEVGAS